MSIALDTLTTVINQYLNLDPDSGARLKALEGKTLKLVIKPISLFFCFEDTGLIVKSDIGEQQADATIDGYPLAFIQLHLSSKDAPNLFKQDLRIEGDIEFGQAVRDLFSKLDIDWEELLAGFTGDVVANQLGKFFDQGKTFFQEVSNSTVETLTEYLQEEAKHLPCREEVDDFCNDVDSLRFRVDRLQAKVNQ